MRYLIIGNGWIGNHLKEYLGEDSQIWDGRIEEFPTEYLPTFDVLINCAAKTQIDWVEKNKNESLSINALCAGNLAQFCKEEGKKYVFMSSACIFESKNKEDIKYEETTPNPKCFYAETKVIAEKLIQESNPDTLIIRPRLPISEVPHPRNTLNKLKNYPEINDNQESVTIIEDMLPKIKELMDKGAKGVFHVVNDGTISASELATAIGHNHKVVSKDEQDVRMKDEGKTQRVTTYVGSHRTMLLPHIKLRIQEIAKNYGNTN